MDKLAVYIDVSPELSAILHEQKISLENIIGQSSQEVDISYSPLKLYNEETHSKDIVPMIIATSVGLLALLHSLSNLLNTYFNRPHFYVWDELEEIREKNKVVTDKDGNPLWRIKRHHKVIYPEQLNKSESIEIDAGIKGIILRVSSSEEKAEKDK